MGAMKLPESLRPYFWNCRFHELDAKMDQYLVIARLLEHGGAEALRWMLKTYGIHEVTDVLKQTRTLSPESRSFWFVYFHIDLPDDPAREHSAWHNRGSA
jgi:hypothetical protein